MTIGRVLGLLVALAPVVAAAQAPVAYEWRNVKVGGGGFAPSVVFSPAERGLAYLRTDMGGAYRWDEAQRRWLPLQDANAVSSFMGVESIAPDPRDPNIVYLAAGMSKRDRASIWRSADRGATWRIVEVPFAMGGNEDGRGLGERLAVDPHRTSTLFFGARHDGLWRSRDSGATWTQVTSFPRPGLGKPTARRGTNGGLSFVVFDAATPGRMIVGSADPGGAHLFRSDDGGASWRAAAGGPADLAPVKAVIGRDGVATIAYANGIGPNGVTRGAVWRLDLASGAWRDVTPDKRPDAPPGGYMGVAVSAADPRVLAVSTLNRYRPVDTVWRSTDGGATWDELERRSARDVSATPFLNFDGAADFGHWIAGLAIDPFDPARAAYVTGATLYATDSFDTPGRMTWRPWTEGVEQTAIITLVSPTGGAPLVSGFGDLGGFVHADLGRSPPGVHRNPYLTNTNTLDYAGRSPMVLVRSGNTHAPVVPTTSVAWSGDGGVTWSPLTLPPSSDRADGSPAPERTGAAPISVSADGRSILVATDTPILTRDRGKSWTIVTGLFAGARPVFDKVDPRRAYAIDPANGRVLRSDDGGARFRTVATMDLAGAAVRGREAANPLVATPNRAGLLWLRVGDDLYRSDDAGARWERIASDLAISLYGLGKAAPGAGFPALYAIGDRGGVRGVYRSLDGGATWRRINDDRHQWGLRFRVISGDPRRFGRVYIGTDGRGVVYGDQTLPNATLRPSRAER